MAARKVILRRKTNDSESDKYEYFVSCSDDGIEMITPFKNKATVINEGETIKVVDKNWQAILAPKM